MSPKAIELVLETDRIGRTPIMSDGTTRHRRALLLSSSIAVAVPVFRLWPTKVSALGISLPVDRPAIPIILSAVICFFCMEFLLAYRRDYWLLSNARARLASEVEDHRSVLHKPTLDKLTETMMSSRTSVERTELAVDIGVPLCWAAIALGALAYATTTGTWYAVVPPIPTPL